jgi:hypothetical protein
MTSQRSVDSVEIIDSLVAAAAAAAGGGTAAANPELLRDQLLQYGMHTRYSQVLLLQPAKKQRELSLEVAQKTMQICERAMAELTDDDDGSLTLGAKNAPFCINTVILPR